MLKQKTVYFREEDLPLWEAVENKAQWLHDRLNPAGTVGKATGITVDEFTRATDLLMSAPIPNKDRSGMTPRGKIVSTNGVCKIHNTPLDSRGRCLQKGCKYA